MIKTGRPPKHARIKAFACFIRSGTRIDLHEQLRQQWDPLRCLRSIASVSLHAWRQRHSMYVWE